MFKRAFRWVVLPVLGLTVIFVVVANVLSEPSELRPEDFAAQPITLPSGEQLPFATYLEQLDAGELSATQATLDVAETAAPATESELPEGAIDFDEFFFRSNEPDPSDLVSMGSWAYRDGRYDEALALFTAVTKDHPRYDRAQRYLGWDLLTKVQNRPRAGLGHINRALSAAPLDGNNWQDAARVYLRAVGVNFDPVHGDWVEPEAPQ